MKRERKGQIESEYKFLIKDIEAVRELLESRDRKRKRAYEKTVMFDNPQKIMQITDGRVRVRIRRPGRAEFSYKKPLKRAGIKREIEYETRIEEPEELIKILREMEFFPTTSYERYRTTYRINSCEVTLDEYPFASFVEIEGKRKAITQTALLLGFKPEDSLDKSCDTLYTEWRKALGKPLKPHLLFSDY